MQITCTVPIGGATGVGGGGGGRRGDAPLEFDWDRFCFRICHQPFVTSAFRTPCHALTVQEIAAHEVRTSGKHFYWKNCTMCAHDIVVSSILLWAYFFSKQLILQRLLDMHSHIAGTRCYFSPRLSDAGNPMQQCFIAYNVNQWSWIQSRPFLNL